MFVHVLSNHYNLPRGLLKVYEYEYWENHTDLVIKCDLKGLDINKMKCLNFLWEEEIKIGLQKKYWSWNVDVTFLIGDDNAFTRYKHGFDWINKLIEGFKSVSPKLNPIFSNFTHYLSKWEEDNSLFKTYKGDFLPYTEYSIQHNWDYWTGFYSTWSAQKSFIQNLTQSIQISKQLLALKQL